MILQTEIQVMKHGTRILVVEDEIIIAEDIQRKLKNRGYDVPSIVRWTGLKPQDKYIPFLTFQLCTLPPMLMKKQ